MSKVYFLFFRGFWLVWAKLLYWQGFWALGYLSMGLDTFLIFPNFLRFKSFGNRYITLVSNNRASFHLWYTENLVKHQKVSKYYEND